METRDQRDVIDVLSCDIGVRPKLAPTFADVAPRIRGIHRDPGLLTIAFDGAAADTVEALVEAERLCCAGIGWQLEREPALRLLIRATPDQLDALEQMLKPAV